MLSLSKYVFISASTYDCDFEVDMCSWTQSYGDTFDWTRQMGLTASVGTGPDGDHTNPSGKKCTCIYKAKI